MIEARELRIGNWVTNHIIQSLPPKRYQITAQCILDIADNRINREHILPIPLTPELLEKAGFEDISPNKNALAVRIMINASEELAWWVSEGYLRHQTRDSGFTRRIEHIKHLHQLQNLYFALMGEELKIDL